MTDFFCRMPAEVAHCAGQLSAAGFAAYLVGGCVRDGLLGREPKDYDIATNAPPDALFSLFPHVEPTGLKHGTVTVVENHRRVEVTRFRIDGVYYDFRHPSEIRPADNILDDLARRDFTVNAMAVNAVTGELVDPFGGRTDLAAGIIRGVGDPAARFREDALRILRAFRFAARFSFTIDGKTQQAALDNAPLLSNISAERVFAELTGILSGARPSVLSPLCEARGLTTWGLPPALSLATLDSLPLERSREAAFAALCWLCQADACMVCTLLKSDLKLKKLSTAFVRELSRPAPVSPCDLKHRFWALPPENWPDLIDLRRVLLGEDTTALQTLYADVLRRREPYQIAHLAIDGRALVDLGVSGPEIGQILRRLLEDVLREPADNRPEILLRRAKALRVPKM